VVVWRTTVGKKGEGSIGVLDWPGATALKRADGIDAGVKAQAAVLK
jgi:hypothetical protein